MKTVTEYQQQLECMVCGGLASGLHYNAVICEACKKFYLRSQQVVLDFDSSSYKVCEKYKCVNGEQACCVVRSDKNRSQCQFCRYQRCVASNMTLHPEIEPVIDMGKCSVCNNRASGLHFGVASCEGCKSFFRRSTTINSATRFECRNLTNNCAVSQITKCRACRLQRCLAVGMDFSKSQVGRQSKLYKRQMHEYQTQLKQSQQQCKRSYSDDESNDDGVVLNMPMPMRKRIKSCDSISSSISNASDDLSLSDFSDSSSLSPADIAFLDNLPDIINESVDFNVLCEPVTLPFPFQNQQSSSFHFKISSADMSLTSIYASLGNFSHNASI